jgi:hypothetical protein
MTDCCGRRPLGTAALAPQAIRIATLQSYSTPDAAAGPLARAESLDGPLFAHSSQFG